MARRICRHSTLCLPSLLLSRTETEQIRVSWGMKTCILLPPSISQSEDDCVEKILYLGKEPDEEDKEGKSLIPGECFEEAHLCLHLV